VGILIDVFVPQTSVEGGGTSKPSTSAFGVCTTAIKNRCLSDIKKYTKEKGNLRPKLRSNEGEKHKEEKRSGVVEEAYEKLKNMDVKKADPFKRGEAECVFRF
jgi:uncharacterized protein Veg